MTEPADKTPVEQAVEHALDLFVYAPVGLLFEGASLLPQLIEKGRSQVALARMVGRFAVRHRRTEATKAVDGLQDQVTSLFSLVGKGATSARRDAAAPTGPATAPAGPVRRSRAAGAAAVPGPVTALAIPDYDGLSASQVVNRLPGLSAGELAAVCRYEEAHRGRKTILSKAAQLRER